MKGGIDTVLIRKSRGVLSHWPRNPERTKIPEDQGLAGRESRETLATSILTVGQMIPWNVSGTSCRGFSLIEVILVIAIIGILSAIAVPAYRSYLEKARSAAAVLAIGVIQRTITAYYVQTDDYPSSLADVGMDSMRDPWGNPYRYLKIAGLDSEGSKSGSGGKKSEGKGDDLGGGSGGGGSEKPRKDHFMVPINTDYDLYSMGPDGKSNEPLTAAVSRDDIIRANDGAFIGRASDF